MTRRAFTAASLAAGAANAQSTAGIPIIDTHIHFYDTTRPIGVPYPGPGVIPDIPVALPETFRNVAAKLGVVGAIELEASPWVEDNLWVLNISNKDPFMVGFIGNLAPEKPEFREYLDRYSKDKLFRGIRCGNIWNRSLVADVEKPEFIAGMKEVAARDLTMDTANPRLDLLQAVMKLTDKIPNLRVVLDHVPTLDVTKEIESALRELSGRKNVYAKISNVMRRVDGKVPTDLAFYKPRFDLLFDIFGEDHVVYGSDWPNSTGNWVPYATALTLIRSYFDTNSRAAAEKYFWKNSVAAYKWTKRDPGQPAI
jgi:predicted TIM-barrel fold metal-dependent hydrolase